MFLGNYGISFLILVGFLILGLTILLDKPFESQKLVADLLTAFVAGFLGYIKGKYEDKPKKKRNNQSIRGDYAPFKIEKSDNIEE